MAGIGLRELPNSGDAKAPPAPPLTTALPQRRNSLTARTLTSLFKEQYVSKPKVAFKDIFYALSFLPFVQLPYIKWFSLMPPEFQLGQDLQKENCNAVLKVDNFQTMRVNKRVFIGGAIV